MKILIVEDDEQLSDLIGRVLREEGFDVRFCAEGRAALALAEREELAALVLDWMLPDIDGVVVCRDLRARGSAVPILMLTARGEIDDRVRGLEAGADDYLIKPFDVEEMVARIRALLRRAGVPHVVGGSLRIDMRRRMAWLGAARLDLTTKEFSLLAHLAQNAGHPVARVDLLAAVWDTRFDPGTNVVEVYMSRLRTKLGQHAWMLETVRGSGYRLRRERG